MPKEIFNYVFEIFGPFTVFQYNIRIANWHRLQGAIFNWKYEPDFDGVILPQKSDFLLGNLLRYYFLPLLLWEKALFAFYSKLKRLQTSFIMWHRDWNPYQKIDWYCWCHLTTFWTHWAIFEFKAIYGTKTYRTEQVDEFCKPD